MLPTYRFCLSSSESMPLQHVAEAQDAVERRAQLVAHGGQKIALEAVHLVEPHVGLGQLVEPVVQLVVDVAQLALLAQKLPQHAVERRGQLFELVARANLGPLLDVALAHGVGHVAQDG